MKAGDIRDLLECRHGKDILCHEAPCGSGQIDTWVVHPSWTKPSVIGYEIKVSRRDFLGDQKWMNYLPYCNEFYFATAPGVCTAEELPEGAGWLEASKNGKRIFTRRKAVYRSDGLELETVFRSVLINRAVIKEGGRYSRAKETREERMVRWRVAVADRSLLGHKVSQAIKDEWARLRQEAIDANRRAADADEFRKTLSEHGLDPDMGQWEFRRQVRASVGDGLVFEIDRAIRALEHLRDGIPGPTLAAQRRGGE